MSQFGIQLHRRSKTKRYGNGKRVITARDKRRSEIGNYFSATKTGAADDGKTMRRRGGAMTFVLKKALYANVLTKEGYRKVKITGVVESRDNRNFARQNVITKGAVISTELGNAVVLNRPGREGTVNAKLS
ncbi:MAG: 30S ribosomal protein S8e [Candidatus Micrarchaeota archaeon]|nr:30S ribosomal protein S8e [Candidatus Micrarchaeota archaeon]